MSVNKTGWSSMRCPYCGHTKEDVFEIGTFIAKCEACLRSFKVAPAAVTAASDGDIASKVVDCFIADRLEINHGNPAIDVLKDKNTALSVSLARAEGAHYLDAQKIGSEHKLGIRRLELQQAALELQTGWNKTVLWTVTGFTAFIIVMLFIAAACF